MSITTFETAISVICFKFYLTVSSSVLKESLAEPGRLGKEGTCLVTVSLEFSSAVTILSNV